MKRSLLTVFAAGLLFPGAAPAAGQDGRRPAPQCGDDRGVDRCDAGVHRRMLELYGLSTIEQHAQAGDQVRRVFYVDGYGREVVAISFLRARGREPRVSVHYPGAAGQPTPPPQVAAVPVATWERVIEGSAHFDRDLAPLPKIERPNTISICLHSWVYIVEASDPPEIEGEGPNVRRKVQDSCVEGLAQPFAWEAQKLSLPLYPHCAALNPDHHRNNAAMLQACQLLEGDRLTAAEAANVLEELRKAGISGSTALFFEEGAEMVVQGETPVPAAAAWAGRVDRGSHTYFEIEKITGETSSQARAEGKLVRNTQAAINGPITTMIADITVSLAATNGFGLRVQRVTIGSFRKPE